MIETNSYALTGYTEYYEPPEYEERELPEASDRDLYPDEKRCEYCERIFYAEDVRDHGVCDSCIGNFIFGKNQLNNRIWFIFSHLEEFGEFIKDKGEIGSMSEFEDRVLEFIEDDIDLVGWFMKDKLIG